MSIGTLITSALWPIIPVTDELIEAPANAPKEQQQKIAAYNELLEVVYLRKTELESLEGDLAAMKAEIEDDIEHLGLKDTGEATLKAQKRRSGAEAITAFMSSRSPVQAEGETAPNANPDAVANGVAGITKRAKSRGKGKGRQEKARLNGMDLKYHKGCQISLDDDDYSYEDEEEGHYGGSSKTSSTEV